MQIFCGTDIIEISRIKNSIEGKGEKFIQKIFTENEIKYCESKNNSKYEHYAARFAAKEAIFKAISPILKNKSDICWQNAEIINDVNGRPSIKWLNIEFKQIKNIDISLSHCREYATANVVVVID